MPYSVRWALLGQDQRRLDSGALYDTHETYGDAAGEASAFLRTYADAWRSEDGTHWKARRSSDADLEVRVWIMDLARAEVCVA
jgi:hypothetical protein